MKHLIHLSLFLFGLLFLSSCNQQSTTPVEDSTTIHKAPDTHRDHQYRDCVFERDTVTDHFIKKNPLFQKYTWNSETKEALILFPNKDSLYVHVGGCMHYGVTATLTIVNDEHPFSDHAYWFEKAMWIAKNVYGFEPEHLKEVYDNKAYHEEEDESGFFMELEDSAYSLIVDRKFGYTHITLNHFFQ